MIRRNSLRPVDDGLLVGRGRQIVRINGGRIGRVGASQLDPAAAFRPQLIDDRGKPRPWMQPVLRPVGAERRARALDVGRGQLGPGAREQRRRRGPHRQRAGLEHVVLQPGLQLSQIALHHVVDGDRQCAFEFERRRIVVLQALPDPRQMVHDRDPCRHQMLGFADPGQHQQLRRVDRTAAQNDLARRPRGAELPVLAERDAGRAPPVKDDFFGQRVGEHAQIGAVHRRTQIADRGRAALAVAGRRLVIADAVLPGAVEIVVARKAETHRGVDERLADRVLVGDVGDAERAASPVECVGAARLMFGALEIRQHVVERPAAVAELAPMVEILGLAADIDHAVDRGRAAQHLAARPEHAAVGGAGVGLGLVAPVDRRVRKGFAKAERDMDPAVLVLAAGLEQDHPRRRVLAQPRGDGASGRAGADHDEIGLDHILLCGHLIVPLFLPSGL